MKLDDLKDLKDLNSLGKDPFGIYFDDDEGKKKKKKKKDKDKKEKKDKDGDSKSYKESLKELSRKELIKKAQMMGIDTDMVDTESKKALRKEIMKARKNSERAKNISGSGMKPQPQQLKPVDKIPPYYLDERSGDFTIRDGLNAPDMHCFNAMVSLGQMRTEKRKDDGFGELMHRITSKLAENEEKEHATIQDAIDVDFSVLDDDKPKALPPKSETAEEAIELTPQEVEQFSKDVDAAIENLKTVTSGVQDKASNGGKKHKKKN